MSSDPTTPDDDSQVAASDLSLVDVLDRFRKSGWGANHLALADARVRCGNCDAVTEAGEIEVGAMHRTEGASDPQDMLYVFGFTCPVCDARGAIVAGYGPAASEQDQALLAALGDDHDAVDPVAAKPE